MVKYLLSDAEDIRPARELLLRAGREIEYGEAVSSDATEALLAGARFVVVAHGDEHGTVYWSRSGEAGQRWLWVGMRPMPRETRVYLYCCSAGSLLMDFLDECECFGHSSAVPMPEEDWAEDVISFLDFVDNLMREAEFDRDAWKERLGLFVGEKLLTDSGAGSYLSALAWLLIGKSIGMAL